MQYDTEQSVARAIDKLRSDHPESTASRYAGGIRQWIDWLGEEQTNEIDGTAFVVSEAKAIWDAEPSDLKAYLRWCRDEKKYAADTVGVRRASVSKLYYYLSEVSNEGNADLPESVPDNPNDDLNMPRGWIDRDTKKQKAMKKQDFFHLEPDGIELLCENVPSPRVRWETMVRLSFHTGVRRQELCDIRLPDINWDARSIDIRGKGSKNRTVYFGPELTGILNEYIDNYRAASPQAADSNYLFVSNHRPKIDPTRYNSAVVEAAERAGIQEELYTDSGGRTRYKISSHTVRHSHAMNALECGIDLRTIQSHLGHSEIETTMKYLRKQKKEKVRQKYDQRFNPSGPEDVAD